MHTELLITVLVLCAVTPNASASSGCNSKTNVRLQGGRSSLTGRVEVCINGQWRTMCAQRFNKIDSTIVCRELGFSDKGARIEYSVPRRENDGPSIWLYDTVCDGHEESILNCSTRRLSSKVAYCKNNKVGVSCQQPSLGELRILGGANSSAGRLEIFANNAWGTVCDDYWSRYDAQVACKQLFGPSVTGARSVTNGFRKRDVTDITPIWLDNLLCKGTESSLISCIHNGIGMHNCNHYEDAGIICPVQETSAEKYLESDDFGEMKLQEDETKALQRFLQQLQNILIN